MTLEELDKNVRQTTKMASDNEQKLDELSRKLGVQEEECKRAIERVEFTENKLKGIEEELQMVGEIHCMARPIFVNETETEAHQSLTNETET